MEFKYEFVGETKRYAKYEPVEEAYPTITGSFYLLLADYRQMDSPQVITLTLNVA